MAGIDAVHVPYKGLPPGVHDVIAGQVHFMLNSLPTVLPLAKAGKIRALGVSSAKRSAAAPEIPTIGETVPGYEYVQWFAMMAPAGTPPAIVNKVSTEMAEEDGGSAVCPQALRSRRGASSEHARRARGVHAQGFRALGAADQGAQGSGHAVRVVFLDIPLLGGSTPRYSPRPAAAGDLSLAISPWSIPRRIPGLRTRVQKGQARFQVW